MTQTDNPLRKYFRQAVIHLRLPSGGRFYPPGIVDLPPNGEIPILPMTAVDEVTSRTPDALFNGSAVVNVLTSCVPNIKDAWAIPAVDFNALLAAVRIASYGHEMEISSTCPKCQATHPYTIDLRWVLDKLQTRRSIQTHYFFDHTQHSTKHWCYKNRQCNGNRYCTN